MASSLGLSSSSYTPNSAFSRLGSLNNAVQSAFSKQAVAGSRAFNFIILDSSTSRGTISVSLGFKPIAVFLFSASNTIYFTMPFMDYSSQYQSGGIRVITEATSTSEESTFPTKITSTGFTASFRYSAGDASNIGGVLKSATIQYIAFRSAYA